MKTPKIVPQQQFDSLGDFIENSNNFHGYLIFDGARSREHEPFYQRFAEAAPELAAELRKEMTMRNRARAMVYGEPWDKVFPWEKLWEAYKLMSNLVYVGDPWVKDEDDAGFLIR